MRSSLMLASPTTSYLNLGLRSNSTSTSADIALLKSAVNLDVGGAAETDQAASIQSVVGDQRNVNICSED